MEWVACHIFGELSHVHIFIHIFIFHLVDSLPRGAIDRMESESEALREELRSKELRRRIQDLLDAGWGSCVLRRPECAGIVQASLQFGDGTRYRLLAWVVMPNHVHVLIRQLGFPLARIVQSWKCHTARRINLSLGSPSCTRQQDAAEPITTAALWQRDYWDRYIRDERHFLMARHYIEQNPVKAGLVREARDWRWGSAGWGARERKPGGGAGDSERI